LFVNKIWGSCDDPIHFKTIFRLKSNDDICVPTSADDPFVAFTAEIASVLTVLLFILTAISFLPSRTLILPLPHIRRYAVGDTLRSVYDMLARDPNSLSNLDQGSTTTKAPHTNQNQNIFLLPFLTRHPHHFCRFAELRPTQRAHIFTPTRVVVVRKLV